MATFTNFPRGSIVGSGAYVFRHYGTEGHQWEIGQEQAWTTAGTFSFSIPDSGLYDITLIGGGGGGGGNAAARLIYLTGAPTAIAYGGGGGRSGAKYTSVALTRGTTVNVTVGAGGATGRSSATQIQTRPTMPQLIAGVKGSAGGYSAFGAYQSPHSKSNGGDYGTVNLIVSTQTPFSITNGDAGIGEGSSPYAADGGDGTTDGERYGADGYSYNGVSYGGGGDCAKDGSSGLVVVRLMAYA